MSIDTSGGLLEGIRLSEGNNGFTFPPRDFVSGQPALDSIQDRAEYVLIADSSDPGKNDLEIADPDLRFLLTRNEGSVVRFRYDSFSRRWLPSPGGPPDELGPLGNDSRLTAPVPDESVTDAPFGLYVGGTVRLTTFTVSFVGAEVDFSPPSSLAAGTVEFSRSDGKLNFSQDDVDDFGGQAVLSQRQSFFDKVRSTGAIGALPASSAVDYHVFMNPRPASGQSPVVRIGYRRPLAAVQVPNEASLGTPASGTFTWSLDTGRVRVSPADVDSYAGMTLYYDGVTNGSLQLQRTSAGQPAAASPAAALAIAGAAGVTDSSRFVVFAEAAGQDRRYWRVVVKPVVLPFDKKPRPGTVYLSSADGSVYMNSFDVALYGSWTFSYLDTVVSVEHGVSVQFFRSGVNGSGVAKVPDFYVRYFVDEQIAVSAIGGTPFVMLPTTPLVDGVLKFSVAQAPGSSGTFTGDLLDGTDPSSPGLSYILDLDQHQLKFANRRTTTKVVLRPSPSLKLDDGAISRFGFELTKNGSPIVAGTDFAFDPDTGLVEFLDTVGVNEPGAVIGLAATVVAVLGSLNGLQAPSGTFSPSDAGKFVVARSGGNQGIYEVQSYVSPTLVLVSPAFAASGSVVVDIVIESEVVADRFWTELEPSFKKFSLAVADSPSGPFTDLDNGRFGVFPSVGQVNLLSPARLGQVFQVTYVSLDSDDNGVTVTPTNRVERALFRVRLETAVTTVGSKVAAFNPGGKSVSLDRPIDAFLNGVPLDPEDFQFQAPGKLTLSDAVTEGQSLVLNYWIEEALGGETNFTLLHSPVDLDSPAILADQQSTSFNGDQTDKLSSGSALFIGKVEVLIVQSAIYDPSKDVTDVTFESVPTVDSAGAPILVTGPVTAPGFRIAETAAVDVFTKGTNKVLVEGNVSSGYLTGTVVTVDGDPFSVLNSSFNADLNKTEITVSAPAKRNHIIPVLTRTVRPILFPGTSFQTKRPANVDFDFTLIRMGAERKVFVRGVDYDLAEGGIISLDFDVSFGDSLHALYVARTFQGFGTSFVANYAYAVAPGSSNGIGGQRLLATYNLYAPDTFFYRIETVATFLPEVQDLLRSSASSGSSGPAIQDATGQANKDFGRPSPYFNEQHLANVDVVIRRLLLFYNGLVNIYEDILSDLDGRIVGGNRGRFRFDGAIDNPVRSSFYDVTNDIDDQVKLYDRLQLTGFFSFDTVPVYGTMAVPNSLSRIFPTYLAKSAALNDQVDFANFGNPMGSLDVDGIKLAFTVQSAKARSTFTKELGSATYVIPKNGDEESLVPRFVPSQDVSIYTLDGRLVDTATVLAATTTEPATVILDVAAPLTEGSIMQDVSDAGNPVNHFYTPGRDLAVDSDNGQVINTTFPPPLNAIQNEVVGEEVIDAILILNNTDLFPKRVPALDGLALNDDGRVPEPPLLRSSESVLLLRELAAFGALGHAVVELDKVTATSSTIPVTATSIIQFLNGPNSGQSRTVLTALGPASFALSVALPLADPAGSDFVVTSAVETLSDVLGLEIGVLSTNVPGSPTSPGSQLLTIASEVSSAEAAVLCVGDQLASGTGTATGAVLTDPSADFTSAGVAAGDLVFVPSGVNRGLFRSNLVTGQSLVVDIAAPWQVFPGSGPTPYVVLRTLSFLSEGHGEFLTKFYRETLAFLSSTQAFLAAPTDAGKAARTAAVNARTSAISDFAIELEGLLNDDNLYEVRYLWIDQRTNRKNGVLTQKNQAVSQRDDDLRKLVEDQQKLLVLESA